MLRDQRYPTERKQTETGTVMVRMICTNCSNVRLESVDNAQNNRTGMEVLHSNISTNNKRKVEDIDSFTSEQSCITMTLKPLKKSSPSSSNGRVSAATVV